MIIDLGEYRVGRFPMRPANQGFKRDDLLVVGIHYRLKCKTEFKTEFASGMIWKAPDCVVMLNLHDSLSRCSMKKRFP
jgi:hypothetical protein